MTTLTGGSDEVEIDGTTFKVIDWQIYQSPIAPAELTITIMGIVPYAAPPFPFNGELWYVQAGTTSATPTGAIQMKLTATNKTMPALPPKSRLRLPNLSIPVEDVHEHCVPLEHYNDLKTFIAMELNTSYNGMMMVPDEVLNAWADWRVLHSKDVHGAHTFIAVDPSVVIDHDDEEPDIPF